jgi:hypothetical protein
MLDIAVEVFVAVNLFHAEIGQRIVKIGDAVFAEQRRRDMVHLADAQRVKALIRQLRDARGLCPPLPTETLNFYCPLAVQTEDENGGFAEGTPHFLAWHEEEISAALREEVQAGENMADYLEAVHTRWICGFLSKF